MRRLARTVPLALALAFAALSLAPSAARAEAPSRRAQVGGYFRVMARPDFQGGNGRLGFWNLYGRLLNEGPWAALELRLLLLEAASGTEDPWTTVHFKIEGGAVQNAEASGGKLGEFRLAQLYAKAGNVLIPGVTWQVGTLETWFGDLGLYDMRPATLFSETLGISGRWEKGPLEILAGVGDAGFPIRGFRYSPILSAGGSLRLRAGGHLEFGVGGQAFLEPKVPGSRFAPYDTPGMDYEDWLRGEVVERWVEENPGRLDDFPDPAARAAASGKIIGTLGFGGAGPLRWNAVHVALQRRHPQQSTTEIYDGDEYTLYVASLTDQRWSLILGDEMQLRIVPERLDLVLAGLYGNHWDRDNAGLAPSDDAQWYASGVLRVQAYLSRTLHLLFEASLAHERSRNGNRWRSHGDSIFESTDGAADSEGLEFGDADRRTTFQGKGGFVLNPLGPGVYVRPSLRVLYGAQYSTQNNAFGNSFVETLSQFNDFGSYERHWHHLLAFEAEAWF